MSLVYEDKKIAGDEKTVWYIVFVIRRIIVARSQDFLETSFVFNPLRPNSDLSQTSHCNIKGLSVSEVMRIENMITQVKS